MTSFLPREAYERFMRERAAESGDVTVIVNVSSTLTEADMPLLRAIIRDNLQQKLQTLTLPE